MPAWQRHAQEMERAWSRFDQQVMTRVRVWARATLPPPSGVVFYMFSGPDYLHAEAFFPAAETYVLSGLEPVGARPETLAVGAAGLTAIRAALGNFFRYGYFITREMGTQFRAGGLTGTLPVLYVFLARAGKKIHAVDYVRLTGAKEVRVVAGARAAQGVRICFSGADGRRRTLYYFRTDLSDAGVGRSGFLDFCARLGRGDSLVKSASYLMHTGGFSRVRRFLLEHSAVIVQDDSGIPFRHFPPEQWRLRPFGQYLGPTEEFKRFYQPGLAALFRRAGARPVNFGIGYRWHPRRTNILVAERKD
ncbi:MAG: hypothetical protein D6773_01020 [Alphaproteobacteria bacterium]|nr:MAG: hypothetical protein D6773_01020 [Alphaproteobacteria bacterium]